MKANLRVVAGTIVFGLALAASPPGEALERDWTIVTLDADGNAGRFADLKLGGDGRLHIVYLRADTGELKLITKDAGGWETPQTIDDSGEVNGHCAVAPTPAGDLPVSYRRLSTGELWFAGPQQPRVWHTEAVTSEADDVGRYLSMVSHGAGGLALAFRNQTQGALLHVRREAGAWSAIETVDPGPQRGSDCGLAYRPGVGYAFSERDGAGSFLALADPELAAPAWATEAVTSEADDVGRYLSMVPHGSGGLALAFRNQTRGALLHMRREAGAWSAIETVDPGPQRGSDCGLAYRPGVGYAFSERDGAGSFLALADPELTAPFWRSLSLDHHADVGRQLALAVGPEGHLDYTYLAFDLNNEWHIRAGEYLPDSVRILSTVVDSVATGATAHVYPHLFVAPGQNWYISFRDATDGHLYMATAESWQIVTADVGEPPPGSEDSGPIETRLLGAGPNPARGTVRIYYAAAAPAPVCLQVLDATGRVVRTKEGRCERGRNWIEVGAESPGGGAQLAAGVYFVKLRVGQTQLGPQRMVIVR